MLASYQKNAGKLYLWRSRKIFPLPDWDNQRKGRGISYRERTKIKFDPKDSISVIYDLAYCLALLTKANSMSPRREVTCILLFDSSQFSDSSCTRQIRPGTFVSRLRYLEATS